MQWFKNNWLIVLVIVGVMGMAYMQYRNGSIYDKLMEDYIGLAADNKKTIEALKVESAKERVAQAKLNKHYSESIVFIEADYNTELEKIATRRAKDRRRLVRAARKDPGALTRAISRMFGIPVYGQGRPKVTE